ncbi:EAL domain-containing protein [Agromyces sp. Marseille-P2726]|uniref:EAL domain-containing protein n=1 Tax=Agromyces sp. Marseille-P2726 TaxID=2709132 RepID=UPI00156F7E0C|nr:EAL domain-containing protein [Agromyces sp. Marseille-P2726]
MSERDRLARELRVAAERGEIIAQYQPQVDLHDGLLVALEALSRWRHPSRGVIAPGEFIPLAEATGAMVAIGDVMLEAACRYGATLARAGRRIEVAVNVAAAQLRERSFVERVAHHLRAFGMPASLLTLELTETRPVPAEAAEALDGLRALGVGVSVDDVRTVEEARARVLALPITELKVDRSVIRRLPDDRGAAAQLLGFARDHGLRSVAEGVETRPQFVAVRELGFDRAQGYLFGRPVAARSITARLAHRPARGAAVRA